MVNMPRQSKDQIQQEGFTLIEVLAGMIIAVIFVLITSQAIAISAVYRVRAQRETEALNWIQEDFESVKFAALKDITATCGDDATITNGYAAKLIEAIPDGSSKVETPTFLNKTYNASRTLSVDDADPFQTMIVSYSITDPDSDIEIVNFYTEVIPDAAFDCN